MTSPAQNSSPPPVPVSAVDPKRTGPCWHLVDAATACEQLDVVAATGLRAAQVVARQAEYGPNRLAEVPPRPAWLKFVDQFCDTLVVVLLVAAVLAAVVGDLKDAVVIVLVVILNAALGFWQEHRAEATLAALKDMLAPQARVRRDAQVHRVAADELVPGDLVLLEAGDQVPADGRVLVAHHVEVAEAALTGESMPVGKVVAALADSEVPLAERINLAYMNTVLTRGRMELLVTATGMDTEMGRLTGLLQTAEEQPTPLQHELDRLGHRLAMIATGVVSVILLLGLLRGLPWIDTLMTSIALAVAAIPEGLPAVVTVTLAIGMHRMARQRAVVKKLAAVETLGCTTVICSDKTGTLTLNQMTARRLWLGGLRYAVSGEGYTGAGAITAEAGTPEPAGASQAKAPTGPALASLLLPAALCCDSHLRDGALIGDPTEGALLALAARAGLDAERATDQYPRIAEVPFDSAHKFMATCHHAGSEVLMLVKGAPDVLLARATHWWDGQTSVLLDAATRERIDAELLAGGQAALRMLALARKRFPAGEFDPASVNADAVNDLELLALVGLIDPPRPEARAAIAECHRAGIKVKMITGDHRDTAAAIADALGLAGEVMTGRDIDALDDAALAARCSQTVVFARVSPQHKVRLVRALRAQGHVVAMTGDGVNDAPALKNADIGIAMGITGTAVTREAATVVLTDDNFATIVHAVREGRTIFENIVKFVRFQLSTNVGAILTVLAASLLGLPTPFTALHLLWINIIMDGPPAMTLGVEPTRPGIMNEPPRPRQASILSLRRFGRLALYGATMAAGTLGMYLWLLDTRGQAVAMTAAFTTFVLFQCFNVFNARAEHHSVFNAQLFSNAPLWLALSSVLALQALVVHWAPAQLIFATTDLLPGEWALAGAVAASVLLFDELRKLLAHLLQQQALNQRRP